MPRKPLDDLPPSFIYLLEFESGLTYVGSCFRPIYVQSYKERMHLSEKETELLEQRVIRDNIEQQLNNFKKAVSFGRIVSAYGRSPFSPKKSDVSDFGMDNAWRYAEAVSLAPLMQRLLSERYEVTVLKRIESQSKAVTGLQGLLRNHKYEYILKLRTYLPYGLNCLNRPTTLASEAEWVETQGALGSIAAQYSYSSSNFSLLANSIFRGTTLYENLPKRALSPIIQYIPYDVYQSLPKSLRSLAAQCLYAVPSITSGLLELDYARKDYRPDEPSLNDILSRSKSDEPFMITLNDDRTERGLYVPWVAWLSVTAAAEYILLSHKLGIYYAASGSSGKKSKAKVSRGMGSNIVRCADGVAPEAYGCVWRWLHSCPAYLHELFPDCVLPSPLLDGPDTIDAEERK